MKTTTSIPERLAEVAPRHLALILRPDCCIGSTWIGLQVLRHFEVPAREHPVAVDLMNAPMAAAIKAGQDPTTLTESSGAWAVSIDPRIPRPRKPDEPPGWNGHLVILTDDRLVDLSFGQFARPEKGIEVAAAHALPFEKFPQVYSSPDGLALVYRDLEDRGFRRAPDWTRNRPKFARTVGAIIRELSLDRSASSGVSSS